MREGAREDASRAGHWRKEVETDSEKKCETRREGKR